MEYVKSLSAEALTLQLKGHLTDSLIQMLKSQNVSGQDFVDLTREDLMAFQFPLGDIKQIGRLQAGLADGSVVLSPSENVEVLSSSSSEDGDQEPDKYAELLEWVDEDTYNDLCDLERQNAFGRLLMWKRINAAGLPCSATPKLFLPSKQDKHAVGKSTLEKLNTGATASTGKENKPGKTRVQLFKPVVTQSPKPVRFSKSQTDVQNLPNKPILVFEREALKAEKPHLVSFDVEQILLGDSRTKHCVPVFRSGFVLLPKDRKKVIRTCSNFLKSSYVSHVNQVTSSMKEGLAKSPCVPYPQLQKSVHVDGKTPWSHLYDPTGCSSNIANVFKRFITRLPDEERKRQKKSHPVEKVAAPASTSAVNVEALALLMPNRSSRDEIFLGMSETFGLRNDERKKGKSITEICTKYPHFLNYSGELIALEFNLMCPKAKDMCPIFQALTPKVINHWSGNVTATCKDPTISACLILAAQLPHAIICDEPDNPEDEPNWLPKEDQLVSTITVGMDLETFIQDKRVADATAVQPYLVGVRSQLRDEISKFFLVIDSKTVDLGKVATIRALDMLFKSFWVFNVHYPPTWKNFLGFLQTCLYEVFFPGDDVPPSSQELIAILNSL